MAQSPIARSIDGAAPIEITIADTIGVAVPTQVTAVIEAVRAAAGGVPLRCHFHNPRNTAIANAYATVVAGVSPLDASVGGIGGCPFAPNATGNAATEDLLYMLSRSGFATGIDLSRLINTAQWVREQRGRALPGTVSRAGGFPKGSAA